MISIKSIDRHIGHESSVGVYLAKRSRIYRIESAAMVSVMFVLLTVGGAPVVLVLVFAAMRKEMALLLALLVRCQLVSLESIRKTKCRNCLIICRNREK